MRIDEEESKIYYILDIIIKWIIDMLLVIVFSLFVVQYYFDSVEVIGNSMNPVMANEEKVLINKLEYELNEPERFDIIAYRTRTGSVSVKRIIGLPGETVQIVDNVIYIDGEAIKDEYYKGKYESGYSQEGIVVGKNEYFVMGDNRNVSEDSRFEYVGNIDKKDILGKTWFVCFPINKLRMI